MMKGIMSLLGGIVLVLASALLQSCSDEYDPGILTQHDLDVNDYTKNFMAHYGAIDPNHNWGFGPILGDPVTRATVDNKNEWASLKETENKYHLSVPGWPDEFNGKYQCCSGSTYVGYKTEEEVRTNNALIPAGDVTEEEIMYVSWWFRTHQNPTSEMLHWTDFFAQEISSDNDRYTEDIYENGVLTHAKGSIKNLQSIYQNNVFQKYEIKDYGINQFSAWSVDAQPYAQYGLDAHWDHIKNFNREASNKLHAIADVPMAGEDIYRSSISAECTQKRLIAYYQSSGTEDFLASYSEDSSHRNNIADPTTGQPTDKKIWVLVHLSFDGPSGRHYDGYYLGFDYQCLKIEGEKTYRVDPDGYYSNWIIKLSPGKAQENSGYSRRVMCEDLGNTYDFDFNDVVFDVTYNIDKFELDNILNNGGKSYTDIDATITIQAAGGTMPIYVGKNPNDPSSQSAEGFTYEVHYLLGTSSDTPTNVKPGMARRPVANYHLKLRSIDPADIPVYVVNTRDNKVYPLNNPSSHNLGSNYTGGDENHNIIHGENIAPQKFCTPNFVPWMNECAFIETGYPYFKQWAQDFTVCPEADTENAWFRKEVNFANIYGGRVTFPEIYSSNR